LTNAPGAEAEIAFFQLKPLEVELLFKLLGIGNAQP
jgi:hypothetical protein